MKSNLKLAFLFTFLFLLAGCLQGCGTQIVTVTKYQFVPVPKAYTLPCVDVAPPDPFEFLTLPTHRRIDLLSDRSFNQSVVIVKCNNKLKTISDWSDEQETIYKNKSSQEPSK
jgi:hypothetical protein